MDQSILVAVKKNLGLQADYEVFDNDVVMFINAAFSTLNDLGVGPRSGFSIEDDEAKWEDFLDPDEYKSTLNHVKTYIYLRVRLLFDPPGTSYAIKSFEDQLHEIEWRMNVQREANEWTDPMPAEVADE